MNTLERDADNARKLYALVKEMVEQTQSPVVLDVGVQMLGLCKILLIEAVPADFEHVRVEREPIA
jgi:hypothetical protein